MRKFARRSFVRRGLMGSSATADTYRDMEHASVEQAVAPPSAAPFLPQPIIPQIAAPPRPADRKARERVHRLLPGLSRAGWVCLDMLIIALAASAAHTLLVFAAKGYGWIANPWLSAAAFCGSLAVAGHVFGLYERSTLHSRSRILVRSVLTLALGVVLAFACLSVFFYAQASRWVGIAVCLVYLATAVPLRLYAHDVIDRSRVRILCMGDGDSIRKLVGILGSLHHRHYEVVGHVRVPSGPLRLIAGTHGLEGRLRFRSEADLRFEEACPFRGYADDIATVLNEHAVDEIIVGSELASNAVVGQAVAAGLEARCRVTDQATFVEKLRGEVPAESITAEWFLRADVQNHGNYEAFKRVVDLATAAAGLLVTLPLWPLFVLLIRLDSRGPALFKQTRVGRHGRCFKIHKFRTMRLDAERDGARWAAAHDTRVTRVGRFLRRSRMDELPQLLNVLRGDMSLVGPRPERPEFVRNLEQLLPHYRLRHVVKPGLTGWAQIHYGYGSSVADAHRKLCYDLYYLKHRSLDLDLTILIRTLGTFLLGAR
jgi:exopolysaccharide biosynthesis polyprenyl glycosylphosphotransferase